MNKFDDEQLDLQTVDDVERILKSTKFYDYKN